MLADPAAAIENLTNLYPVIEAQGWKESVIDTPATETVTVVGPICETGDRLGSDRLFPPCNENDVILIANTGAYGYVMRSNYNRRADAVEIVI